MRGGHRFVFGVPPSLGREPSWELARELAALLDGAGFSTVIPCPSYEELERRLLDGSVDAAWAPPIVCGRVEAAGGAVALRGVRGDERTYRSVLVIRSQDVFDLDALGRGRVLPRVAWVDRSSVGGYLLPRAHLRGLGVAVDRAFLQQRMLGSYAACVDALLGFETDLTALFVGQHGLEPIWGAKARRLKPLAYTEEVPNDGVVIGPGVDAARADALLLRLGRLLESEAARAALTAMLKVDDFDHPPPGTYAPVLRLL